MSKTDDLRIANIQAVANAATIMSEIPISDRAARVVASHRADIHRVLQGEDDRLVVVTGPCSIHDPSAAIDYARHLAPLVERHKEELIVLMRVYFEKPRTTVGWKGLINDPNLDGSFDINSRLLHWDHGWSMDLSQLPSDHPLPAARGGFRHDAMPPRLRPDR